MSKASPESITEFIKYATPRLEYLADMEPGQMEKDASVIAKLIASGAKLSAKNQARLEQIAKARNMPLEQLLKRDVIGKRSIDRIVNTANGPVTRKAVLDNATRNAALSNRYQAVNNTSSIPRASGRSTSSAPTKSLDSQVVNTGSRTGGTGGTTGSLTGGTGGTNSLVPYIGGNVSLAGRTGKTGPGFIDRMRGIIQKNPLAFTVGAGAAGSALGDQLGHRRGYGAGQEYGTDTASQYYNTLIEKYKNNYSNDIGGILSRIGNVFAPTKVDSIFSLPKN